MPTRDYIIAYDIFDPKRLYRVRKIVYSYALEGQKSAIEAPLDRALMRSLVKELLEVIDDEDRINIIKVSNPMLLGSAKEVKYENGGVIIV